MEHLRLWKCFFTVFCSKSPQHFSRFNGFCIKKFDMMCCRMKNVPLAEWLCYWQDVRLASWVRERDWLQTSPPLSAQARTVFCSLTELLENNSGSYLIHHLIIQWQCCGLDKVEQDTVLFFGRGTAICLVRRGKGLQMYSEMVRIICLTHALQRVQKQRLEVDIFITNEEKSFASITKG